MLLEIHLQLMCRVVSRFAVRHVGIVSAGTLLFSLGCGQASAQGAGDQVEVLNSALLHRLTWQQDRTPVLACGAFTVLGEPQDFPEIIPDPLARELIEATSPPCERTGPLPTPRVNVMDVDVRDSTATVTLRVVRAERSYSEVYTLNHLGDGSGPWTVAEVVWKDWLITG